MPARSLAISISAVAATACGGGAGTPDAGGNPIDAFPTTARWEACAGSDCPVSTITRYRKAAVDVDGAPVDLVIGSQIAFWVVHP